MVNTVLQIIYLDVVTIMPIGVKRKGLIPGCGMYATSFLLGDMMKAKRKQKSTKSLLLSHKFTVHMGLTSYNHYQG